MTKKQVKEVFHAQGIQINNDAVNLVLDHLKRETETMAQRVKQGNYKRLSVDTFWVAIGDWGIESAPRKLN